VFGIVSGATWPTESGLPNGPYTNANTYVEVTLQGKIQADTEIGQSFDRALAMNDTEFENPPVRGLSAGCVYFLSPGVSGGLSRHEPTMATQVSKPVLLGATSDTGYILQYRGQYLQGSGTGGTGGIDNNRFFVTVQSGSGIERGDVVGFDPAKGGGEGSWYTVSEGTDYEHALGLCVRSPFTLDGSTYIEVVSTGFVDDIPVSGSNASGIGSNIVGTGVLYIGANGKLTDTIPPQAKPFAVAWKSGDGSVRRGVIVNQNHSVGANFAGSQRSAGGENGNWAYRSTSIGGATYGSAINENILINGGFDVWQRRVGIDGSHGATGTTYFADRWVRVDGLSVQTKPGTCSIERKEFGTNQSDVYGNPKYYARIQNNCTPVGSRDDHFYVENRVEDVRTVRGEDVTLSFWARSGVTGTTMGVVINQYDGTSNVTTQPANVSLGTLWSKYEISMLVPDVNSTPTGKHYVGFGFDTTRLLTTHLDIAQVKVERGLVATRNADTSQEEELNKCRRYYQRSYDIDEKNHSNTMLDDMTPSITSVDFMYTPDGDHYERFPVKMRGTPAITFYSPKEGYTGDVFNRTGNVDARNANGSIGHNGQVRSGGMGGNCITSTYATENGIYMYVPCGAVLWDHLSVQYVADADLDENMPNKMK